MKNRRHFQIDTIYTQNRCHCNQKILHSKPHIRQTWHWFITYYYHIYEGQVLCTRRGSRPLYKCTYFILILQITVIYVHFIACCDLHLAKFASVKLKTILKTKQDGKKIKQIVKCAQRVRVLTLSLTFFSKTLRLRGKKFLGQYSWWICLCSICS
jgi:hypothetical protein